MPAYSTNAAKLLARALAFSVIKHRFQIDMYGFFPFFRNKKNIIFFCLFLMHREFTSMNGLKESLYIPEQ